MNDLMETLDPESMEQVLGYTCLDCMHQNPVEHSVILKHNRYFFMANPHGDISPAGHCSLGLFFDDTRILSHYALRVKGGEPSLLSSQIDRSFTGQTDLAIKDTEFGGDSWDPRNCVHIRREVLLDDRLMERITLTNYMPMAVDYWIELQIGCDFADIFEVRGWKRKRRGEYFKPVINDHKITSCYRGIDGKLLASTIRFGGPNPEIAATTARWNFHMAPNSHFRTEWEIFADNEPGSRKAAVPGCRFDEKHAHLDAVYEEWSESCSKWNAHVAGFQDAISRAVDDLRALHVETEGVSVISAGIPWFSTFFGRDSIITSLQTLPLNPRIAIDTLRSLARYQGTKEDHFTEEQPGKMLHEIRRGEMARTREIPHLPYYGTIDATPLWLILLHETWHWTGDDNLIRELMPNAERALEWIDRYGDIDGDGFVEHQNGEAGGLSNQGWKDSSDGVPFPDATMPKAPIALVEVQGYVYDAKMRMAEIYRHLGKEGRAGELREQAAKLRVAVDSSFWMEEEGTYGLALDGTKKLLRTITSNAGHLLWSGLPDPNRAKRVAESLLSPAMFSGWGIRTLSSQHDVFNPMSYHNGSIWPHDNAIIIKGMARYRLADAAVPVVRGLYDAATHDEFQRLPELFCGMQRGHAKHPVLYPVSCSPQAWASGSLFMIMQSMLGIQANAHEGTLHIKNPVLPDFIGELNLSDLAVGKSKVSLQFKRYRKRTLANLLSITGDPLRVQIELT